MSKTLAFTGSDLVQNFDSIDRWIKAADSNIHGLVANEGQIIETLQMLTDYAERLEGRVQALENIKLVVRAPRGSKLFLLTAVGLASYGGYKYALKKFADEIGQTKDENLAKSKVDHPAGRKINGDATNGDTDAKTDNPEK